MWVGNSEVEMVHQKVVSGSYVRVIIRDYGHGLETTSYTYVLAPLGKSRFSVFYAIVFIEGYEPLTDTLVYI